MGVPGLLSHKESKQATANLKVGHWGSKHASATEGQRGFHKARLTPDEVTRTLASLADLRDRGAISADEYEHKKDDLLGRL